MTENENAGKSPVGITLYVAPQRLSMAERDRFRVGLTASNNTNMALDPHLYVVRLLVNGSVSAAFDIALGNGVMPAMWDLLPAGASTSPVDWPLGMALFPEPGEYLLVLRLEWNDWAPVESSAKVNVTP